MGTHYHGDNSTTQALDTFIKLTRASNSVATAVHKSVNDAGLTVSQFGVLEALHHLGPMCQRDLAQRILKTGGNLTMVIDNLEKKGWVQRVRAAHDRRYIEVTLTSTGSALIRQVFPKHARDVNAVFSGLNRKEQHTLGALCKKLGKSIDSINETEPETQTQKE